MERRARVRMPVEGADAAAGGSRVLRLLLDPELLRRLEDVARRLDTDVPTLAQWCLRTGLFLEDLNRFVRSKMAEEG